MGKNKRGCSLNKMAKKRKKSLPKAPLNIGAFNRSRDNFKTAKKELKRATLSRNIATTEKTAEKSHKNILKAQKTLEVARIERRKQGEKIIKGVGQKLRRWANEPVVNRKILRKGPRPVLDLRRRPEREVPIKQHGFKEGEIGHGNLL